MKNLPIAQIDRIKNVKYALILRLLLKNYTYTFKNAVINRYSQQSIIGTANGDTPQIPFVFAANSICFGIDKIVEKCYHNKKSKRRK